MSGIKLLIWVLLSFLVPSVALAQSGVSASYIRMTPTALPTACRQGDVRIDTTSYLLQVCSAANTWTATLSSGGVTIGTIDSQIASANGLTLASNVLYAQSASGTNPGMANTSTQTFAGAKTFSTSVTTPALISSSSSVATSGALRLASGDVINWRNNAGTSNIPLGHNTSDQLTYNSGAIFSPAGVLLAAAFPTLTGDITTPGGSLATTLATVNSQVGTYGGQQQGASFTVNAKGLVTAVATATPAAVPTPYSFAAWDGNNNLVANAFLPAATATPTAATTVTLTVSTPQIWLFTGSTTDIVSLPVASTLAQGSPFFIMNGSSGTVTVKTSGANTIQAMAQNTILLLWCMNPSGGTGTASWNWAYMATQNSLSGGGTVSSVTFTGDGTVLSSTPSGAVTASGTVTATLNNANANTFLMGAPSGGAAQPTYRTPVPADIAPALTVPSATNEASTGSTAGYYFTVTSATVGAGCVFTNNTHSYTVVYATTAKTYLFVTGTGALSGASGTLAYSSGGAGCNGAANLAYSANQPTATYTSPTSPSALYLEVWVTGGGGGGGGGGSGSCGSNPTPGGASTFGDAIIAGGSGSGGCGANSISGAGGGTPALLSVGTAIDLLHGSGGGGTVYNVAVAAHGGQGGASFWGGQCSTAEGSGNAPADPIGYGTGGCGGGIGSSGTYAGEGGGSGSTAHFFVSSPAASYQYSVGAAGALQTGGTGGSSGSNGVAGRVLIVPHYQ